MMAVGEAGYRFSMGRTRLTALGTGLVYLAVVTAFTGAAFGSFSVGGIHLFPYRLVMVALWVLLASTALYMPMMAMPGHMRSVRLMLLFFGLWVVYAVLHTGLLLSVTDYLTHIGFLTMGTSLIFFAAFYLRGERQLAAVFRLWFAVLVLLVAFGYYQTLTGYQLPISQLSDEEGTNRFLPMGTFPRLNQYATFLALSAPLLLSLFACAERFWLAALAGAGLLPVVHLILIIQSQSSLLTVAAQVLTAIALFMPRRRRWFAIILAVVGFGALLIITPQPLEDAIDVTTDQVERWYEQMTEGQSSLGVRFRLALNGLLFFLDSGGLGIGAGNFNAYIEEEGVYSTLYQAGDEQILITYPHNWWIELLSEYGLLVFVGFIAVFVTLVLRVAAIYRQATTPMDRLIGQALILGLVGYVFAGIGPGHFTAFRPQWVLLALAVAYVAAPRQRE
jgi:teichuronic acid biosynthesis protein TuaE